MDNIVEGFERDDTKEFRYVISISKGCAREFRSQFYRALDYEILNENEDLINMVIFIKKQL